MSNKVKENKITKRLTLTVGEKRSILLASSLFTMMFHQIDIPNTKRVMKKITRAMKNMLATYRATVDAGLYLKLINDSVDITATANSKSKLRKKQLVKFDRINSGSLFRILYFKERELFNTLGVNYSDVEELLVLTKEELLLLPTLTFTNRLLTEIDNYINLDYGDTRTVEDIVADINKKTGKTTIKLKQHVLNTQDTSKTACFKHARYQAFQFKYIC